MVVIIGIYRERAEVGVPEREVVRPPAVTCSYAGFSTPVGELINVQLSNLGT
jgi:hypothetical protein